MRKLISHISSKWIVTPKRLFLIDAIGACLTIFLLSQVVGKFTTVFGYPASVINILLVPACCFAIYSFCCYFFVKRNQRLFIQMIAAANLMYCFFSIVLIGWLAKDVTTIGILYLLGEIFVITLLVCIEWTMVAKSGK